MVFSLRSPYGIAGTKVRREATVSEIPKEAREALRRCYEFLLSLPPETESEDAGQPGSDAASVELTSTDKVHVDHRSVGAEQPSSDRSQPQ